MLGTEANHNRPTGKLMLASVLLILALTTFLFDKVEREGVAFWKAALMINLSSLFIFYAVFTIPTFQTLVGLMMLILGFFGGLMIWGGWISALIVERSIGEFSDVAGLHCITLWAIVTGSLLVIDKDIAKHRRQITRYFPTKDRLNPKVDNFPDDPINPS